MKVQLFTGDLDDFLRFDFADMANQTFDSIWMIIRVCIAIILLLSSGIFKMFGANNVLLNAILSVLTICFALIVYLDATSSRADASYKIWMPLLSYAVVAAAGLSYTPHTNTVLFLALMVASAVFWYLPDPPYQHETGPE